MYSTLICGTIFFDNLCPVPCTLYINNLHQVIQTAVLTNPSGMTDKQQQQTKIHACEYAHGLNS